MPLSPYAPPDLSSPTYRDQLDYIVCEDGKAIGRMYDDRRGKEQRSPTAWSAPSSNPRPRTKQIQPASDRARRDLRPIHRGFIYSLATETWIRPLMPMAASCSRRQINDPAAHERASIINGHNSGLTVAPVR